MKRSNPQKVLDDLAHICRREKAERYAGRSDWRRLAYDAILLGGKKREGACWPPDPDADRSLSAGTSHLSGSEVGCLHSWLMVTRWGTCASKCPGTPLITRQINAQGHDEIRAGAQGGEATCPIEGGGWKQERDEEEEEYDEEEEDEEGEGQGRGEDEATADGSQSTAPSTAPNNNGDTLRSKVSFYQPPPPPSLGGGSTAATRSSFHEGWPNFVQADELRREMAVGSILYGFIEGPLRFPPR